MIRVTCLGWSIVSKQRFLFLRNGSSWKELKVDEWDPGENPALGGELLVRWKARPDRLFHGSVHRMDDGALVIHTSDAGWFRLRPDDHVVEIPGDVDPIAREVRLWTTPMLLLSTIEGLTPLHAASVDIGGRAVALSAPGGFGKSTLAAGLVGRGHGLVTEDITVLDAAGRVVPGPDLLRLRPPAMSNLRLGPQSRILHRSDERVMVRTGSRVPDSLPLAAVVFLKEATENALERRVDPRRIADLWQVSFHLPNLTDRGRAFGAVTSLANEVPIYDLYRPLDWDSMEWSMDAVEDIAR